MTAESGSMITQVIPVEFPSVAVYAAAAQNTDGSYNVYVNTRKPPEVRRAAIAELIGRIGGAPRQLPMEAVSVGTQEKPPDRRQKGE